jgi:hypothetical protein
LAGHLVPQFLKVQFSDDENRWDEKAGLRRDALSSQVIDALEAQEIKETGNEEGYHYDGTWDRKATGWAADHRTRCG